MSQWPSVTLDELSAVEPNSFVDGPFGSDLKTSEYVEAGVPLIRIQNVKPNRFLPKEIRYISEAKARQLARHEYRPGDVVITKLGEPCGVACLVPESAGSGIIVADIVRFRGDRRRVDHGYLSHFINSPTAAAWVYREAKGTTRQRVNLSNFRRLPVPLPPLSEQRRIAEILDKADALRAKRRAALAQLDTLTQSIFLDMFGDPATNPKGWPTARLGELCSRITDGTHQPPKWSETGNPFLFVSNVISGELDFNTAKFISDETYAELTRRCPIEVGDVLYSTVGSYGVPALVRTERRFAFQRHIAHLKPDRRELDPEFLRVMLASPPLRRQADCVARGIAQKTVNLADIREFMVFKPPLDVQRELARSVTRVETLKAIHSKARGQCDGLFASIQHRSFSGEL